MTKSIPEKVRCSINRKWFTDENGLPADRGTPVFSWCDDHNDPMPLRSLEDEQLHDKVYHA